MTEKNFLPLVSVLDRSNLAHYLDAMAEIEENTFGSEAWSKEAYARDIAENPHAFYTILTKENILLAYAGFWLVEKVGYINNVAVRESCRGYGLGKVLMQGLIEDCRRRGGEKMTLEVRESNERALRLYTGLGFFRMGVRPRYYTDNGEGAVILWLDLREKSVADEGHSKQTENFDSNKDTL